MALSPYKAGYEGCHGENNGNKDTANLRVEHDGRTDSPVTNENRNGRPWNFDFANSLGAFWILRTSSDLTSFACLGYREGFRL